MIKNHSASTEDYLEAIMLASGEDNRATVTQISRLMGVKKPSVTLAISRLSDLGLASHERYGEVTLTEKGSKIARDVFKRHQVLTRFLVEVLNVDKDTASEDACRMEHYLSASSREKLEKFVEFVMTCPQGRPLWLEGFDYYINHGQRNPEQVARCTYLCDDASAGHSGKA